MVRTYPKEVKARILHVAQMGHNWKDAAMCNDVNERTARSWVQHARATGDYEAPDSRRGGARNCKIMPEHVDFHVDKLGDNCHLTLHQMQDLLLDEFGLRVAATTVRDALDGVSFTLKQVHRDSQYRNTPANKEKRKDFVIKLLKHVSADKKNYGWSKAGTRAVELNTSSKGRNIHVIACISRAGLGDYEGWFGSYKTPEANDYMRRLLSSLSSKYSMESIAIVLDNAPCHNRVEEVFAEDEFAAAHCLRLGPYSPMLNGIENVFSAYKAAVKRFMSENRASILTVPPSSTIAKHHESFLYRAAEEILPGVASPDLCRKCIHRTYKFIADAILMNDMRVSE